MPSRWPAPSLHKGAGRSRLLFEVGLGLVTAGVVVLLFVAYELLGTNLSEQHSQAHLAREFKAAVSQARPPPPPRTSQTAQAATGHQRNAPHPGREGQPVVQKPSRQAKESSHPGQGGGSAVAAALPLVPTGGALDYLMIPAIGVDRYVVQGVTEGDLQMGPGHYPGTPLPGQRGNVGVAGHRTTFGAPFFRLNELVPGDLVYLTDTSGTTWAYKVERQWVVAPADVGVLGNTPDAELTLTTCNPRFEATTRLVVRAVLADRLPAGAKLLSHLPARTTGALAVSHPARGGRSPAGPGRVVATTAARTSAPTSAPSRATTQVTTAVPTSVPAPATGSPGRSPSEASPTVGPAGGSAALSGGGWATWAGAIGWGVLALAAWVATRLLATRQRRYTKELTVLAGAAVCLVPLWFAFESAVNLLPANF
ncbi:MAG: sortase [Acidimicrobiales bacterium]